MAEDKTEDYGYDFIKTLALAGAGILAIYTISKYFDMKHSPILLGNVKEGEHSKKLTVNIPEFWVAHNPGDSRESIVKRFTPEIKIEGGNWVLHFKEITANIGGIVTSYRPTPVEIPITDTITIAELAAKVKPKVTYTNNPTGWNIDFPKFTILA